MNKNGYLKLYICEWGNKLKLKNYIKEYSKMPSISRDLRSGCAGLCVMKI